MLIEAFTNPRQPLRGEYGEVIQRFIAEKILNRTFESEDELRAVVQTWPAFAADCLGSDSPLALYTKMVAVWDSPDPCIKWTGKLGAVAYLHEVVRIADQGLQCRYFGNRMTRPCHHTAKCVVVLDVARDPIRPSCEVHKDAEWRQPTLSTMDTIDPKLLRRR